MFIKNKFEGEIKEPSYSVSSLINYGIVVLDKPPGPTSHQIIDFLKGILELEKAGHSGTLDPAVTGVLPVGLGKATRLMNLLLKSPKGYVGIMHLHGDVEEEKLRSTVNDFIGKIEQLPPVKSAVKRQLRTRSIYEFELLEIRDRDVLFNVKCEAGTYIRKLCHDLGEKLGVGAHMSELRRTKAGPFTETNITTLHDLKDAFVYWKKGDESYLKKILLNPESALGDTSKVWAFPSAIESLSHGRDLSIPGLIQFTELEKGQQVGILGIDGKLIALGTALMDTEEVKSNDKGVVIKTEKVFL